MSFSALFIRRPVGTVLLSAGLFIAGVVAYFDLPVSSLPNIDLPTLNVSATLPGASPETMAATVAAPLERRIGEISGVTDLTSSSRLGFSSVTVQFELSRNIEDAARDVQAAINGAQTDLPGNLSRRPTIRKFNPSAAPILILAVNSPNRRAEQLYDIADLVIATRIAQVDGVAEVRVGGSQQPAMRVTVDPDTLKARGIGLEAVRNAIAEANALLPLGRIEGPQHSFTLSTGGQLKTPADYGSIVLKTEGGAVVRLGDVARIEESRASRLSAGWFNKDPAVILIVSKTAEGNVVKTVDAIRAIMPEVERLIPPDVTISTLSDQTIDIRKSIDDLQITLGASIALVTLVVFLFLRRLVPTFAAMVSVPLSLAGTVVMMWLAGFNLDTVSLLALTISVGFVVDDAIVMIENCYRNMQLGLKPAQAALAGARQIGFTIVSISLSLVAAFIPLLFTGGIMGRILQEFGWTLTFAILISAVISLTVTPMVSGRFMHRLPRPRETWTMLISPIRTASPAAAPARDLDRPARRAGSGSAGPGLCAFARFCPRPSLADAFDRFHRPGALRHDLHGSAEGPHSAQRSDAAVRLYARFSRCILRKAPRIATRGDRYCGRGPRCDRRCGLGRWKLALGRQ
jgi:multidrug efflux pump